MKSIFETVGYNGMNVEFSPLIPNLFSCVSVSQSTYGMSGTGGLQILDYFVEDISNPIKRFRSFTWPDGGLSDCSWSPSCQSILWTGSTDGRIQVWDLDSYLPIGEDPLSDFEPSPHPVRVIKGHARDIQSVEWNRLSSAPDHVLTASRDRTIRVWDASTLSLVSCWSLASDAPDSNLIDVGSVVSWSHHMAGTFASASSDGHLRLWSTNEKQKAVLQINSCSHCLLSVDCSPHDANTILISSSSGHVSLWDLRSPTVPVTVIPGHRKPVKKASFSPHARHVFASVSCDFTARVWDVSRDSSPLVTCFKHHTDHVNGFAFNAATPDQVVDCGSDSLVCLYSIAGNNINNTASGACGPGPQRGGRTSSC